MLGVMRGNRFAASDRHLGRSGAALRLEGPQIADILTRVRVSVRGRGRVRVRVRVRVRIGVRVRVRVRVGVRVGVSYP